MINIPFNRNTDWDLEWLCNTSEDIQPITGNACVSTNGQLTLNY